jgi:protein SCO1/2
MQIAAVVLVLWAGPTALAQEQYARAPKGPGLDTSGRDSASRSRWGANYFPNIELVSHEGQTLRFFDDLVEDKVVVINFIFTSCTDACPLDTARLKKVQQILGDRVGRDIFIYSISIDPDVDTPEVLAKYAERFRAGPGWLFLTGDEQEILHLRRKLGVYMKGLDQEVKDHNMSLLIGNQRTGQWMKRSPMDSPYFIADQIGSWLTNWEAPSEITNHDYANAPELQVPSMGENLYRSRCSVCHTIGAGNGRTLGRGASIEASQHRAGPDLLDVTHRRDRDWLGRWLANPAELLAEGDPLAMQLYAEYDEVLMPNLRLNEVEVDALIEYMAAESRRVKTLEPAGETATAPHDKHHHH